jgi:diguanylate cyclase (GGDEF)-like protein/PAS domain S-box-containing protein
MKEKIENSSESVMNGTAERIARFCQLFGSMSDAAFLVETQSGTILACNDAAERLTGYSRNELLGTDIGTELRIQDPHITAETILDSMAAGEGMRFVNERPRKDGTTYWDEVVLVPFRTEDASVHVSINRDISNRARRQQALRDSEMRYRSIFESTTDAVFIFDRNGRIVEVNPNALQMYGYEDGEMIGLPADKIIHPDYFHGFSNFRTGIDRSGYFRARSVNLRKDGTPFDIEVHGGRFIFQGSPHLLAIVRDIGSQVEVERDLETARLKVERLHEAANRLADAKDEATVYQVTIESAQRILEFGLCSMDMAEGAHLVVKATSAELPPQASVGADVDGTSVGARTYRTGQTIVFGSLTEVPDAQPTQFDFQSGISVPVGSFGVFQVASRETNAFTSQDVHFLELLLGHTAQAIERIRLQNDLVMQANHDPLTGTFNRRYFNQVIEQELARSKRHERSISFLMIDVNRFKEINDTFGHQTGDEVLRTVADLLRQAVREGDLVVRYGGDEFLIVLMEAAEEHPTVADRIAEAVSKRNQTNELIPFPVTLSIGSSLWKPSTNLPIEAVLAEADRKMYDAKRRQSNTPLR